MRVLSRVLLAQTFFASVTVCLALPGGSKQASSPPKALPAQRLNQGAAEITQLDEVKDLIQFHKDKPEKRVYAVPLNQFNRPVTDNVLKQLATLDVSDIRVLSVSNCKITDAGLAHIRDMTSLQNLFLNDTQITDVGVENIKGFTKLQQLNLAKTQLTDAGLENLKAMTTQQWLDLGGTQVTDTGLDCLNGLDSLRFLRLTGSRVTDGGLNSLRRILPKCEIQVLK